MRAWKNVEALQMQGLKGVGLWLFSFPIALGVNGCIAGMGIGGVMTLWLVFFASSVRVIAHQNIGFTETDAYRKN